MKKLITLIRFELYNKKYGSKKYKKVGYEMWIPWHGWCYSKNGYAFNGNYISHTHKKLLK